MSAVRTGAAGWQGRSLLLALVLAVLAVMLGVGLAARQHQTLAQDMGAMATHPAQAARHQRPQPLPAQTTGQPTLSAMQPTPAATLPAAPQQLMRIDAARWRQRGYDGLVNPDLARLFEQILGRTSDAELAQHWLAAQLAPADLERAAALLERYRRYREAQAELSLPDEPTATQSQQLARIVAQREALQREYFTDRDIQGLFADDNRYDHYTIGRLGLLERTDMTLASKEQEEQRLASRWLTEEQRAARAAAVLPHAIARQNAMFEAQQASAAERQSVRSAQFGAAAAQRMAQLDQEQQAWQQRIAAYAAATPEQQQSLREQAFSASERLRLDGAVAWYRQRQSPAP